MTPTTPRRRPWLKLAILAFWLVMVALLLRREAFIPTLAPSAGSGVFEANESWLVVRQANGRTIGHVHVKAEEEQRHGLAGGRFTLESRIDLEVFGRVSALDLRGWIWRAFEPPEDDRPNAELEFQVGSESERGAEIGPDDYDFRVVGALGGGKLQGELIAEGERFPIEYPVDSPLIFGGVPGASFELPVLEVGDEVKIETFDPMTLGSGLARVRCLAIETLEIAGEPIETRHLRVLLGGFESHAWVDDRGEVVRAETPVGLVVERSDAETVRRVVQGTLSEDAETIVADDAGGLGFLEFTVVRPSGERPFRGADAMTVSLSGVDALDLPSDTVQQRLEAGRYQVVRGEEPSALPSPDVAADFDPSEYLGADLFVQSRHPKIRQQAESIVGDETDPWKQALALHEWVFVRIDKEPALTVPSALEVLKSRRGDCNEHTVLYTALARAVGLPTKIAIGIVWSDEHEGFYYHAWPQVHVDGRWIWLDPTLGQPIADATHLKLLEGSIERWAQLLPYLGQLEIEVEEVGAPGGLGR